MWMNDYIKSSLKCFDHKVISFLLQAVFVHKRVGSNQDLHKQSNSYMFSSDHVEKGGCLDTSQAVLSNQNCFGILQSQMNIQQGQTFLSGSNWVPFFVKHQCKVFQKSDLYILKYSQAFSLHLRISQKRLDFFCKLSSSSFLTW